MNVFRKSFSWLNSRASLVLIYVAFSTFVYAQNNDQPPEKRGYPNRQSVLKPCKVYGKTLDLQDAIISGVNLKFQGNGTVQEITSDNLGNYNIMLPAGVYNIVNDKQNGLARYKRSNLFVDCQRKNEINVYFLPVCLSYGCNNPKKYYSSFSPGLAANRELNAVINFLGSNKEKTGLVYTTAVLTYDNLTVYADKLTQDNKTKTITAKGNVWLENGEERVFYNEVLLNFGKTEVEIVGKEISPIQRKN